MKAITIKPRPFVPKGRVYLMPDTSHPEVDLFTPMEQADALVIACHPDHEQLVRDAVAIEQERPKWWRDLRSFEAAISAASRDSQGPKEGTDA